MICSTFNTNQTNCGIARFECQGAIEQQQIFLGSRRTIFYVIYQGMVKMQHGQSWEMVQMHRCSVFILKHKEYVSLEDYPEYGGRPY